MGTELFPEGGNFISRANVVNISRLLSQLADGFPDRLRYSQCHGRCCLSVHFHLVLASIVCFPVFKVLAY